VEEVQIKSKPLDLKAIVGHQTSHQATDTTTRKKENIYKNNAQKTTKNPTNASAVHNLNKNTKMFGVPLT